MMCKHCTKFSFVLFLKFSKENISRYHVTRSKGMFWVMGDSYHLLPSIYSLYTGFKLLVIENPVLSPLLTQKAI